MEPQKSQTRNPDLAAQLLIRRLFNELAETAIDVSDSDKFGFEQHRTSAPNSLARSLYITSLRLTRGKGQGIHFDLELPNGIPANMYMSAGYVGPKDNKVVKFANDGVQFWIDPQIATAYGIEVNPIAVRWLEKIWPNSLAVPITDLTDNFSEFAEVLLNDIKDYVEAMSTRQRAEN